MKITYKAAISSDGYIARPDGDVSWLDEAEIAPEDTGLDEFFEIIDGLVMGRKTYDFVFDYGSWPYGDILSWILTHRDLEPLEGANLMTSQSTDDVISEAKAAKIQHMWLVGGGQLASEFLDRGFLTDLSITELPVELGEGIPLFANHSLEDIAAESSETMDFDGFRQIEVVVKKS